MNKATLTKFSNYQEIDITSHRKEDKFTQEYSVICVKPFADTRYGYTPVTLRFYQTNARAYAVLWVSGKTKDHESVHLTGKGLAGGYGYHKLSAATSGAIDSMGIKLDKSIFGVGDTAIEDALLAIAREVTSTDDLLFLHHAHS